MGADLYITPLYQKQRQTWQPEFDAATQKRDQMERGSAEYIEAQARVEECYEELYAATGYFRDPYNDWDLLWKFGLSWWNDVIPMLDGDGQLSVAQAQQLLAMLSEREKAFGLTIASLPAEDRRYFRSRYAELQRFLTQAIDLDTPIEASL